jgi:hypothetical protein
MHTNISLTKLLWEMRPTVLPMTLKQSDKVPNWLVRHPLKHRNLNSLEFQSPHQEHVDNIFRLSRRSAQRICTTGKNSKCIIL